MPNNVSTQLSSYVMYVVKLSGSVGDVTPFLNECITQRFDQIKSEASIYAHIFIFLEYTNTLFLFFFYTLFIRNPIFYDSMILSLRE